MTQRDLGQDPRGRCCHRRSARSYSGTAEAVFLDITAIRMRGRLKRFTITIFRIGLYTVHTFCVWGSIRPRFHTPFAILTPHGRVTHRATRSQPILFPACRSRVAGADCRTPGAGALLASPSLGRQAVEPRPEKDAQPLSWRTVMGRHCFTLCAGLVLLALASQLGMSIANAQVFHDDFNGTSLDPAHWVVAGGGTIAVAGGTATLAAPCVVGEPGVEFPYVTTLNNPFPATGDFLIRVGFRYPDPQAGGNGFGATNGLIIGQPGIGYWLWQDFCCGGLRAGVGETVVPLAAAPETNYHVYEWQYLSGVYHFYVDGVLTASAASAFRPTGFFFGHPPLTTFCPWTAQQIDFVHVEPLGVTATACTTWGRLKAIYR